MAESDGRGGSSTDRRGHEDGRVRVAGWYADMPRDERRAARGSSRLSGNRIARVLFYIDKHQRMVVLHGFIKKSRETPATDLAFARANKRAHERTLI